MLKRSSLQIESGGFWKHSPVVRLTMPTSKWQSCAFFVRWFGSRGTDNRALCKTSSKDMQAEARPSMPTDSIAAMSPVQNTMPESLSFRRIAIPSFSPSCRAARKLGSKSLKVSEISCTAASSRLISPAASCRASSMTIAGTCTSYAFFSFCQIPS